MMYELYAAISSYPEYSQEVLVPQKASVNQDFLDKNSIICNRLGDDSLSRYLQKLQRTEPELALIFHKLMHSDTSSYNPVYGSIPIVVINHTYSPEMAHNFISKCNCVVFVSKHMKSSIRGSIKADRIEFIHNGVNQSRYMSTAALAAPQKDIFVTGRINNMNAIKYSDSWISWTKSVKLPVPMRHEYIGGGAYIKQAKNVAIKTKGQNSVIFHGCIKDFNEKISILKSWDVFLYEINRDEGTSISVLESLACGVPVICSNHFGNKEIIVNGVNGYVFKDRKDAENILKRLILNRDELEKLKISTSEHFAKHLDARIMTDKYINIIKDIKNSTSKNAVKEFSFKEPKIPSRIIMPPTNKRVIRETINYGVSAPNNGLRIKRIAAPKTNYPVPGDKITLSAKVIEKQNIKNKLAKKPPYEIVKESKVIGKEEDLFSILTSCFNNGKYLDDWSDSIIRQSYRPLEVVFVNDASTDDSINKILEISTKLEDNNIAFRIIANSSKSGCGKSYYHAASLARGYYIGVLDADDALLDDAVSVITDTYKNNPKIAHIYTNYMSCDSNMKDKREGFCKAPGKEGLLIAGLKGIHAYSHFRTASKRIGVPFNSLFSQSLYAAIDKYMGYKLEEAANGMFLNKVLYKYRSSVSGSISTIGRSHMAWITVMNEAQVRRRKGRIRPFPIIEGK